MVTDKTVKRLGCIVAGFILIVGGLLTAVATAIVLAVGVNVFRALTGL